MTDNMDMSRVIVPKSNQLNADDLLATTRTIKISKMVLAGDGEQPVSVYFEGDNGKPYKPCKSMARVMVHAWGADAKKYVGKSMTLYCDPSVKWAGMDVGGIRISHMSDIDKPLIMALTTSKGNRKPYTVKPLKEELFDLEALVAVGKVEAAKGKEAFTAWYNHPTVKPHRDKLKPYMEEFKKLSDNPVSSEPLPDATQAID